MLSDERLSRYELLENLTLKNLSQCDGNVDADVDDRGDCNSSPCTSYRRAKNEIFKKSSFALVILCSKYTAVVMAKLVSVWCS